MLINDCLGSDALPGYKSRPRHLDTKKRVSMLHINQSLCPFDRILCEQTALSHELSPFLSGGRPNQFQVLDYSELAGT